MHLGVVPQGFEVPHALHRRGDGLPVDDAPGVEVHRQPEARGNQLAQDLQLHLAHELHVNLLPLGVPADAQQRVLLFQLSQLPQHRGGLRPRGQPHPVGQHGLQLRLIPGRLDAQSLPRPGVAQARHGADAPGGHGLGQLVALPGVDPQLVGLLLPVGVALAALQLGLDPERPPGDLQPGEAVVLPIPGDFEHPRPEGRRVFRPTGIALQPLQQGRHALDPQRRAEIAGEDLPPGHQTRHRPGQQRAGLHILRQRALVAEGQLLIQRRGRLREVHAAAVQPPQGGQQRLPPRAGQVHLVDEQKGRNLVPGQQLPQGAGVPLHAVGAADDQNRVVQHLQRPLHLGAEVHVARGVQQRDLPAVAAAAPPAWRRW